MCIKTGLSCESRSSPTSFSPCAKIISRYRLSATHKCLGSGTSWLQIWSPHPHLPPSDHCVFKEMTRMRQLRVVFIFLWTVSGACADTGVYLAPICNVTETSGLTTDCAKIISYLQYLGNADCCVHEHNECTTMRASGTCRARICTLPFLPLPKCQSCRVVAEYVRNVANLCAQSVMEESRSGGLQVMKEDSSLYIVLY